MTDSPNLAIRKIRINMRRPPYLNELPPPHYVSVPKVSLSS